MTSDTKSHLSVDTISKVLFLSSEYVSLIGDSDRRDRSARRSFVAIVTVTEGKSRHQGRGHGKVHIFHALDRMCPFLRKTAK